MVMIMIGETDSIGWHQVLDDFESLSIFFLDRAGDCGHLRFYGTVILLRKVRGKLAVAGDCTENLRNSETAF
jgi:hypothetical protein